MGRVMFRQADSPQPDLPARDRMDEYIQDGQMNLGYWI
jgi:hypothetical protein